MPLLRSTPPDQEPADFQSRIDLPLSGPRARNSCTREATANILVIGRDGRDWLLIQTPIVKRTYQAPTGEHARVPAEFLMGENPQNRQRDDECRIQQGRAAIFSLLRFLFVHAR